MVGIDNDGHEGQGFRDIVLVVWNDRGGKGLCHRVKDVSIDIRHLDGLFQSRASSSPFKVFLIIARCAGHF